jgi:hypothetical protein
MGSTGLPRAYELDSTYRYWILPAERALELLDDLARILLADWNRTIAHQPPDHPAAQHLGKLATLVARTKSLRYQAHLRWLAARYFADPLSPETVHRLFELLVAKQHRTDWEAFRLEMKAVYTAARDLAGTPPVLLSAASQPANPPTVPVMVLPDPEELKKLKTTVLDWNNTTGIVRKWWDSFERENDRQPALVLQVARQLALRRATIQDFFQVHVAAETNNAAALMHYL